MKYKFYAVSEKAWDAMLEAIRGAKESIYLEMYIFSDNIKSHNFFEVLKQKALAGVRVRIIADSYGSFDLESSAIEEIRNSGAELIFFSHWLQRTHKKILVVDEKIAFLGGVNIHEKVRHWDDLQIRFEGAIVKNIINSFAKTYRLCGGEDPIIISCCKITAFKKASLWLSEHQSSKKFPLKRHYQREINNAKKNITIITPYFAPHRWLIVALHSAVLRGVDVHVMIPRRTNYLFLDKANYFYASLLGRNGIRFSLTKHFNHAKAMLIDDAIGVVGSQNMDALSFDHNLETGVFFTDKCMISDLKKIIIDWQNEAGSFDPKTYKPKWYEHLLAPFIRLFQPIL